MGIRFVCPNGHPLHVKAELSGRRGVCPHCQAKFLIPGSENSASTDSIPAPAKATPPPGKAPGPPASASPAAPTSAAPASPSPTVAQPPTAAPGAPPTTVSTTVSSPAPAGQAASAAAWYIRPVAGGQFGPADEQLLRQWADEGRIAADTYVWRTGWPDWRRAADVAQFFPHLATSSPAPLASPNEPAQQKTDSSAPATAAAERYRQRKKQAAQGQQMAAILLVVVALALGGVLLWVLQTKGTNDDPKPIESPPAVAAPNEEDPEQDEAEPADDAEQTPEAEE